MSRADPSRWEAILEDPTLAIDRTVAAMLVRDLQNPSRRWLLPVIRLLGAVLLGLVLLIKRLLPFQFRMHRFFHRTFAWSLHHLVAPEATYLIVRHFTTETNVLAFILANSGDPDLAPVDFRPVTWAEMAENSIVLHDVNLFNALIDIGQSPRAACRARPLQEIDFSGLVVPEFPQLDLERRRWHQCLDLRTAIHLLQVNFVFCLTEDEFDRAVNSFPFDASLVRLIAAITGDPGLLGAIPVPQPYTLLPASTAHLARDLVLHGIVTEQLHFHLEGLRERQAALTRSTSHV
jgi:hypothetical protein